MTLIRLVPPQFRPQWETFTVMDRFETNFLIPVDSLTVTQKMVDVTIGNRRWSGVRYRDDAGNFTIGYGAGDPDDPLGYTEEQAYAEWIGYVRNQQRILKAQLPVVSMPNTVFDALMSLYINTGKWRTVEADEGTYDMADAVKNANWLLVADILSRGKTDRLLRQRESAMCYLGDYTVKKTRQQHRSQGIQSLRKRYIRGIAVEFDRKQTEFVYYRQLRGTFLPGMSQLRQRRVAQTVRL